MLLFRYGFLPECRYASAGLCESNVSVRLSVRPSVCPSVCHTMVLCHSVMISSLSDSPTILVFWCQILRGFPGVLLCIHVGLHTCLL